MPGSTYEVVLVLPGQSWMIPVGTPHDAKAGSGGAKVIAVYMVETGKPLASPAN